MSTIKSKSLVSHAQDGLDLLYVLVVGHASLAVGPVLEDRLHDGDGLMGKKVAAAGILELEKNAFLSVYIHSVGYKKQICIS